METRLVLIVYKRYFDAILAGKKKIEYRRSSDYWIRRLLKPGGLLQPDEVEFRNGYRRDAPRARFRCRGISWRGCVFLIRIGERIE